MKIEKHTVYLVGGIGMLVGSFFAAAKALCGIVSLIYIFLATDFAALEKSMGESISYTITANHVTGAIYGIASFIILFLGARWLISGPGMIDRWIDRGKPTATQTQD